MISKRKVMDVTLTLLLVAGITGGFILIKWFVRRYRRQGILKRYKIPGPTPDFFAGNMYHLRKESTPHNVMETWLKNYGKVFGYYMGGDPFIVVNDLNLIKQIMIDDFATFNNRPHLFKSMKPMDKTLVGLRDQRWQEVRNILNKLFSPETIQLLKKLFFDKRVGISVELICDKAYNKEMFDIHDLFQRQTLDLIADCAFTMKSRCQQDSGDNLLLSVREFMCDSHSKLTEFGVMFPLFATLRSFVTSRITAHSRMNTTILGNLSVMIIARRTNPNLKGKELVQLMVDESDRDGGRSDKLTEDEVIANCYLITLMAYETASAALASIFYLLIKHPKVQNRLCEEIDATPDVPTIQSLQSLIYLDQVYKEALRLYPPVTGFVSRYCQKDTQVGSYTFPKGANIQIPIWNIHHDPDLWPDPYKFDPERFSPQNKGSIKDMSYMPFGEGPRNCIGKYYAELQIKLAVFRLLETFKFEACEKTEDSMTLATHTLYTNPANGVWLRAIRRKFPAMIE